VAPSSAARTVAPLKIVTTTITVPTAARVEIQDLTSQVAAVSGLDEIAQGTALLHSLHTTTARFINEAEGAYGHNDPAVSAWPQTRRIHVQVMGA
jgi:hypothetical protein